MTRAPVVVAIFGVRSLESCGEFIRQLDPADEGSIAKGHHHLTPPCEPAKPTREYEDATGTGKG
jgi:hypothetical protein